MDPQGARVLKKWVEEKFPPPDFIVLILDRGFPVGHVVTVEAVHLTNPKK